MQWLTLKGSSGFKVEWIFVLLLSSLCQLLLVFQKLGVKANPVNPKVVVT